MLSRLVFYLGVLAIALIMRIATPDPIAHEASQDLSQAGETEAAQAYFAYPNSQ